MGNPSSGLAIVMPAIDMREPSWSLLLHTLALFQVGGGGRSNHSLTVAMRGGGVCGDARRSVCCGIVG